MSPQEALERVIAGLAGREPTAVLVLATRLALVDFDQGTGPLSPSQKQKRYRDRLRASGVTGPVTRVTKTLPPTVTNVTEKVTLPVTPQDTLAPRAADLSSSSDLLLYAVSEGKREEKGEDLIEEGECEREKATESVTESVTEKVTLPVTPTIGPIALKTKKPGVKKTKALPPSSVDPIAPTWLVEKNLPPLSGPYGAEVAKMLDWHIAENKSRSDWPATWRNWLTREGSYGWRPGPAPGHGQGSHGQPERQQRVNGLPIAQTILSHAEQSANLQSVRERSAALEQKDRETERERIRNGGDPNEVPF